MEIQPILAALRKHKIPATLIVLEIALACAVLCNAVFMIGQRIGELHLPDAIDEAGLVHVSAQGLNPKLANADIPRDLAALRAIPGVRSAAAVNMVPLTNSGWNSNIATGPGQLFEKNSPNVATYYLGSGGPETLGLHLLQGRVFNGDEYADGDLGTSYIPSGHSVVLTRSLAQHLWPDQNALGKEVWLGKSNEYTVVGIVADVLRPNENGGGLSQFHWAAFFPVKPSAAILGNYIVRTAPQDRERVLHAAVTKLEALSPNAVVKAKTFTDIRDAYFATTRSMVWMLVLVCVVMLAVTAFGIVGLTSFWVSQRRRQIGIRRALGATRHHILSYFQTENFLLSTLGVALGMILAYGANLYLMTHYQLDRMPWYYLPASAIALWILGQLAVLGPALRAANVPPVVATRGG